MGKADSVLVSSLLTEILQPSQELYQVSDE
jgi:hypothetical protein